MCMFVCVWRIEASFSDHDVRGLGETPGTKSFPTLYNTKVNFPNCFLFSFFFFLFSFFFFLFSFSFFSFFFSKNPPPFAFSSFTKKENFCHFFLFPIKESNCTDSINKYQDMIL